MTSINRLSVSKKTDEDVWVEKRSSQQLQERIIELCTREGEALEPEQTPAHEASFIRLQNELIKGLDSLFVFVEHPDVEATNNRSERNVRREAEIRSRWKN